MDQHWMMELVADVAAFTPDQTPQEILEHLVKSMMACSGKLDTRELRDFVTVAAAIYRLQEGSRGW